MRKTVSIPRRFATIPVPPLLVLALLPQMVAAQNATGGRYSEAEVGGIVAGAMVFVVLVGVLISIACIGGLKSICERKK